MTPEAMARRLRDGLKRKNKLTHAVRLGPWAREFAALCAQVGAPRCARVLEWYCTNLRRKFVPRAYSAGAFRGKFLRIEDAMVRTPVPLTISAEAEGVCRHLGAYSWPKGAGAELPAAAQRSLDELARFRERLSSLRGRGPVLDLLIGELLHRTSRPTDFVVRWLEDSNRIAYTWADWSGSLSALALKPQGKRFRRWLAGACAEFAGASPACLQLLELLDEEES
jgi:hypothetical protein